MKDFRKIWKQLAKENKLEPLHYMQRAVLIAVESKLNTPKEDIVLILLNKYFTPVTNANKLKNGATKYGQSIVKNYVYLTSEKVDILDIKPKEFFDNEADMELYYQLANNINMNKIDRKYVYYFTIQDILTPEQQGVQAGHALYALGSKLGPKAYPKETYFQWVGTKDSTELNTIAEKYKHLGPVMFHEPDVGHKLTSVAIPPVMWYRRGDLTDYQLLTHAK